MFSRLLNLLFALLIVAAIACSSSTTTQSDIKFGPKDLSHLDTTPDIQMGYLKEFDTTVPCEGIEDEHPSNICGADHFVWLYPEGCPTDTSPKYHCCLVPQKTEGDPDTTKIGTPCSPDPSKICDYQSECSLYCKIPDNQLALNPCYGNRGPCSYDGHGNPIGSPIDPPPICP